MTSVGTMDAARRGAAVALAALIAVAPLAACAPDPAPTPTPTGFASEEEAFAAAEATFDSYVKASNAIDVADPSTFEPLFALSIGDQNAFDRERLSRYHADGYSMVGATRIVGVEGEEWDGSDARIQLLACVDVSSVDVLDDAGVSVVSEERPDVQSLTVELTSTAGGVLVQSVTGSPDTESCLS